jgi:hypothetical protein
MTTSTADYRLDEIDRRIPRALVEYHYECRNCGTTVQRDE